VTYANTGVLSMPGSRGRFSFTILFVMRRPRLDSDFILQS